ncbi:MAG: sensory rhodopsin transducer [Candidatus Omnitrophota bacterium]
MAKKIKGGAGIWYFPDGYLPKKTGRGLLEAHEALMILNVNDKPADVKLDLYFEDREPVTGIPVTVGARRVKCLRMDNPQDVGGHRIPALTQYSLRVRSNVNVVVQFGRLDSTQENLAYYVGVGYCE